MKSAFRRTTPATTNLDASSSLDGSRTTSGFLRSTNLPSRRWMPIVRKGVDPCARRAGPKRQGRLGSASPDWRGRRRLAGRSDSDGLGRTRRRMRRARGRARAPPPSEGPVGSGTRAAAHLDLELAHLLAVEGHAVALERALELEHRVLSAHAAVAHDRHHRPRCLRPFRRRLVVRHRCLAGRAAKAHARGRRRVQAATAPTTARRPVLDAKELAEPDSAQLKSPREASKRWGYLYEW